MIHVKRAVTAAAFVVFIFSYSFLSQNKSEYENLPNFSRLNDNLARGAQPKEGGFEELKKLGIATVIDLRDDDENALKEKVRAESAGLRFINLPLGNWSRPDEKDIAAIEAAIDLPENQPVFVHCKRGADRTGTVIAVYRMRHDGWDAKRALDEAGDFGIGWWQLGMKDFINDYYRDHVAKK